MDTAFGDTVVYTVLGSISWAPASMLSYCWGVFYSGATDRDKLREGGEVTYLSVTWILGDVLSLWVFHFLPSFSSAVDFLISVVEKELEQQWVCSSLHDLTQITRLCNGRCGPAYAANSNIWLKVHGCTHILQWSTWRKKWLLTVMICRCVFQLVVCMPSAPELEKFASQYP